MNSKDAQIIKYGGIEGYRAEMRRRVSLRKMKTGFAIMEKEKILEAQRKSAQARTANAKAKRRAKKENAAKSDSQEAPETNNTPTN